MQPFDLRTLADVSGFRITYDESTTLDGCASNGLGAVEFRQSTDSSLRIARPSFLRSAPPVGYSPN